MTDFSLVDQMINDLQESEPVEIKDYRFQESIELDHDYISVPNSDKKGGVINTTRGIHLLMCAVRVVQLFLDKKELPFVESPKKVKGKIRYVPRRWFINGMSSIHNALEGYNVDYDTCAEVDVFYKVAEELGLRPTLSSNGGKWVMGFKDGESILTGEIINEFASRIRQEMQKPEIKMRLRTRKDRANRNYRSGVEYLLKLLRKFARLEVIRIDFGYLKEHFDGVDWKRIKDDFTRFLNNKRSNKIFKHQVGYMWQMEYGEHKGFHLHCIFFLDGSKVRQAAHHAQGYGEYWVNTITKGKGCFYNCNYAANQYRHLGIGTLNYDDEEKIKALMVCIRYITKCDQFMIYKPESHLRRFDHGRLDEVPNNRGRPRSKGQST